MDTIYFFAGNREINKGNVRFIYSMLDKVGFQPAVGKIRLVDAAGLDGVEIVRVSIVPKMACNPISLKNFDIKRDPVTDENEKQKAKIVIDGQHRLIALYFLEVEKKIKFDAEKMTEVGTIPENMNLVSFIYHINSGKAWTVRNFGASEDSTGNLQIDYIANKIKETMLEPVVVYSFYTLGQPTVKPSVVKELKLGLNTLPKKLKLDDKTQMLGDLILETLEKSKLSKDTYDNGRFAKGFKYFYDHIYKLKSEDIIELISTIDKDFWFEGNKPEGSPETKQYAEHFQSWYEKLHPISSDDENVTIQQNTSLKEEVAPVSEKDTASKE